MTVLVPGIVDPVSSFKAQAKIRATVGLPVLLAALIVLWYRGLSTDLVGPAALIHISYIVLMLILAARVQRFASEQLAFATAILDPLLLSCWVLLMEQDGGLVIGFYLFTILGFGFRLGPRLMLVCQIASIAGFAAVNLLEPFWRTHEIVWLSFMITLVVVPLYAMVLVKKLHEARAHAERESQAKSQLLAKVSHELRTPLSGIVAAAQLISAEVDDKRVANRAETIMGLSRDLLREIDDLLDQAKYEARALVLESSLFDLRDQMDRLCVSLEPSAAKKGLIFAVNIDPRIRDRVQGDSRYLSKVLLNLAGNAVKFTHKGKVEIAMTLLEENDDHLRVRFSVKDTGIGIPGEFHDRIFEPFFQADSHTARKYGGTGLGMTIAKEIVNLMGGQIQVESEPGVGSLFYFDLNFARVTTRQTSVLDKTAIPTVYGKRILIVDDNATNLSLLQELLLRDRHEVVAAGSGADALELLSQREFDVVFLDFNLGDIDGAKVLQIYKFGRLRAAPVYFLTADATAATAEKLSRAGAIGVLNRPITIEGLRQAIARVCSVAPDAVEKNQSASTRPATVSAVPTPLQLAAVPAQHLDYRVIDGLGSISDRSVFLAEVLGSAVADIERNCSDLMRALAARDSARVRDAAHALKGVCATVGATRLESLANRLMRTTSDELVQAGARLSADVGETSRQSVAAIRNVLLERAVNG